MGERTTSRRWLALWRNRRGVAAVEAAFVLPPFITLLLFIIEVGVYFTMQTSLDTGVLATAETLRSNMVVGSAFAPPTAAALKTMILSNGGAMLGVSNVAVDVRQLTTLSAGAVAVVDGSDDWGGSGAILVVRAQTTLPFLPGTTSLTVLSTSIVRRPPY
jgi:Flp pilus assembly protein TadG